MSVRVYSVAELTRRIKDLLEIEIDRVWISGEISSFKVHAASGHAYFNLKDRDAVLACVCWASSLRRLTLKPADGLKVRAFGSVSVYEARGTYQLYVEQMRADGEGALQAAFLELKRKLEAEGLFDPSRKRALPRIPTRIGLVTSGGGAALQDMMRVLAKRWPSVEVVLRPALVQGAGAAEDLARALREVALAGPEVVIIGRGGGSLEDLAAFNDEVLARAIAASPVPVVSAVGHETDFSIADFVADLRAATPTHAAQLVVPDRDEVRAQIGRSARALASHALRGLREARRTIERLRQTRPLRRPEAMLRQTRLDLDRTSDRLRRGLETAAARPRLRLQQVARRLERREPAAALLQARARLVDCKSRLQAEWSDRQSGRGRRLELAGARLEALSPRQVLARGYSITRRARDGAVVRAVSEVAVGEEVEVVLARGSLRADVTALGGEEAR